MMICTKCGCEVDDLSECCPGCLSNVESRAKELWQILVMLKRELDPHDTKPDKYELPKAAWDEAVKRANR